MSNLIAGVVYGYGRPYDGASIDAWKASRFAGQPAANAAPPSGVADAGPVISGENFGGPGRFNLVTPTSEAYYWRSVIGNTTAWAYFDTSAVGSAGATGATGATGSTGATGPGGHHFAANPNVTGATPNATANTYGTAQTVTIPAGQIGLLFWTDMTLTYTGIGVDTVTTLLTATYNDATTATVTNTATANVTNDLGGYLLGDASTALRADGKYITSLTIAVKSNITSSSATVKLALNGIYTP